MKEMLILLSDMKEIIAALIASLVTILLWFRSTRNLANEKIEDKRREIRLTYLINAYQRLEGAANRRVYGDSSFAKDIEMAIADIQLFGTRKQIELAQGFSEAYAKGHEGSVDELLDDLRIDLRTELNLTLPVPKRTHLRVGKSN